MGNIVTGKPTLLRVALTQFSTAKALSWSLSLSLSVLRYASAQLSLVAFGSQTDLGQQSSSVQLPFARCVGSAGGTRP